MSNAYQRHQQLVRAYSENYKESKKTATPIVTDLEVLRRNHKFLRGEAGDDDTTNSWEARVAKKYYDRLFKEYCLADLRRYKENKVAMRWRIEKEVVGGKGQFECGNLKCQERKELKSWEVNFGYMEGGEKKNALVKLRLCPDCSYKLNYHKIQEMKRDKKRKMKKREEEEEEEQGSSNDDDEEGLDSAKRQRVGETTGSTSQPPPVHASPSSPPPATHPSLSSSHSNTGGKEEGGDARRIWKDQRNEAGDVNVAVHELEEGGEDKTLAEEMDDFLSDLFQ